ncbi:MAG: SDR family oxidoreductase [Anaerolineales bacterium]|jgi:3-dehydrosphinganine reductase
MKFKDRLVLITGGSSGIGLAIAKICAKEGANVLLLARTVETLESAEAVVANQKVDPGQKVATFSVDVREYEAVEKTIKQIENQFGTPDYVVNSAGVAQSGYFQEMDLDIFRWMMDVNYLGTVYVNRAVVPGMIERKAGHIVNISSILGFLSIFGYTAYAASKYAVRGFSDALRAEMKPHGIHVSIVFPPDTQTPQFEYDNKYKPAECKALTDVGTVFPAEEVAQSIVNGILKHKYMILPGYEGKLLYWLSGWLGTGVYPIMDFMLRNARNNHNG